MHCHGPARAERVCSDVFWGKAESGRSHPQALGSDDGDDVGSADGTEAMIGGIIADGGGRSTGRLSRRWAVAIDPHAWETDSFPSPSIWRMEYLA